MAGNLNKMAVSPRHHFSGKTVLRIPPPTIVDNDTGKNSKHIKPKNKNCCVEFEENIGLTQWMSNYRRTS